MASIGHFFQRLPALSLFLIRVRLLKNVSGVVFIHLEVVRCGGVTTLVIQASVPVDVISAGCVQWVPGNVSVHVRLQRASVKYSYHKSWSKIARSLIIFFPKTNLGELARRASTCETLRTTRPPVLLEIRDFIAATLPRLPSSPTPRHQ